MNNTLATLAQDQRLLALIRDKDKGTAHHRGLDQDTLVPLVNLKRRPVNGQVESTAVSDLLLDFIKKSMNSEESDDVKDCSDLGCEPSNDQEAASRWTPHHASLPAMSKLLSSIRKMPERNDPCRVDFSFFSNTNPQDLNLQSRGRQHDHEKSEAASSVASGAAQLKLTDNTRESRRGRRTTLGKRTRTSNHYPHLSQQGPELACQDNQNLGQTSQQNYNDIIMRRSTPSSSPHCNDGHLTNAFPQANPNFAQNSYSTNRPLYKSQYNAPPCFNSQPNQCVSPQAGKVRFPIPGMLPVAPQPPREVTADHGQNLPQYNHPPYFAGPTPSPDTFNNPPSRCQTESRPQYTCNQPLYTCHQPQVPNNQPLYTCQQAQVPNNQPLYTCQQPQVPNNQPPQPAPVSGYGQRHHPYQPHYQGSCDYGLTKPCTPPALPNRPIDSRLTPSSSPMMSPPLPRVQRSFQGRESPLGPSLMDLSGPSHLAMTTDAPGRGARGRPPQRGRVCRSPRGRKAKETSQPQNSGEDTLRTRLNVRQKLEGFQCREECCVAPNCKIVQEHLQHIDQCVAGCRLTCRLCDRICSMVFHSAVCQNMSCSNTYCVLAAKKSVEECFGDPDFVTTFLKSLGMSDTEMEGLPVLKVNLDNE